ncbi:hypothetical protein FKP32DRAFT_1185729 [Trametes sanguinea]|nr:hypothetical protein FKP32DRAFT_1185729 [Trametes sanguinea]
MGRQRCLFSRTAAHSIPNGLAACTLGGDMYFVTWDPTLLPDAEMPPLARSLSPSSTAPHRRRSSRRQDSESDMAQAAIDTFMQLNFNPLSRQMTDE